MQTEPTIPEPIITLRPRRPRPKVVSLTDRAAERVRLALAVQGVVLERR